MTNTCDSVTYDTHTHFKTTIQTVIYRYTLSDCITDCNPLQQFLDYSHDKYIRNKSIRTNIRITLLQQQADILTKSIALQCHGQELVKIKVGKVLRTNEQTKFICQ